jgi:biopolymer transport protein ExbB
MIDMFILGGPIMWPLLVASIVALTVVFERLYFIIQQRRQHDPTTVERMLTSAEKGDFKAAHDIGAKSHGYVAKALTHALGHRDISFSNALLHASSVELQRFNRGISVLDTIVTLAPLLGLLGTVTGMIRAFSLLGASELGAPTAITGGIAEALIATAFGLIIAMVALLPFNFLNARLEQARQEIENAAAQLEMSILKHHPTAG